MAPHRLNPEEMFEDEYTSIFRARFGKGGVVVKYERDRAGRDLGFHLRAAGSLELSNVRVWFQLKGLHADTVGQSAVGESSSVPVDVDVEDVKRWYAAPEAVYVVVYLEAVDQFVGEEIRDLVDRRFADNIGDFSSKMASLTQKSITLRVETAAAITQDRIEAMLRHRAMRIDGPSWRGRPLGHRIDPLRSELSSLDPSLFVELAEALLNAHDFRVEEHLDAGALLDGVRDELQEAYLLVGRMYSAYEWLLPITVEYGTSPESNFREEGEVLRIADRIAVLVHSRFGDHPRPAPTAEMARQQITDLGADKVLVLANAPDTLLIGSYRSVLQELYVFPQGHGSMAYSVLTCPLVFMDFQDRLRWKFVNYLWEDPERPRVRVRPDRPLGSGGTAT